MILGAGFALELALPYTERLIWTKWCLENDY